MCPLVLRMNTCYGKPMRSEKNGKSESKRQQTYGKKLVGIGGELELELKKNVY